jgi:hypothetical protein
VVTKSLAFWSTRRKESNLTHFCKYFSSTISYNLYSNRAFTRINVVEKKHYGAIVCLWILNKVAIKKLSIWSTRRKESNLTHFCKYFSSKICYNLYSNKAFTRIRMVEKKLSGAIVCLWILNKVVTKSLAFWSTCRKESNQTHFCKCFSCKISYNLYSNRAFTRIRILEKKLYGAIVAIGFSTKW